MQTAKLLLSVDEKKEMLKILIKESTRTPWAKIKSVFLEIIIGCNAETSEENFLVRVSKLPEQCSLPTSYFGTPVIYLELPETN